MVNLQQKDIDYFDSILDKFIIHSYEETGAEGILDERDNTPYFSYQKFYLQDLMNDALDNFTQDNDEKDEIKKYLYERLEERCNPEHIFELLQKEYPDGEWSKKREDAVFYIRLIFKEENVLFGRYH